MRSAATFIFLVTIETIASAECPFFNKCRLSSLHFKSFIARGRCGERLEAPFTCACDSNCTFFSDCCEDYGDECSPQTFLPMINTHSNLLDCIGGHASGAFSLAHIFQTGAG